MVQSPIVRLHFLWVILTFVGHNIVSFHMVFRGASCVDFEGRLSVISYKR